MKMILKMFFTGVLAGAMAFGLCYPAMAFALWEISPALWSANARTVLAIVVVTATPMGVLAGSL